MPTRKTSARQLDREIAAALRAPRRTRRTRAAHAHARATNDDAAKATKKPTALAKAIAARRDKLAKAAQTVIDGWKQDDDGFCDEYGTGGACDAIADKFQQLLDFEYVDATGKQTTTRVMPGGHEGDDHAWLVVYDDNEAVRVDLPPQVYESGGGYNWRKRPNVKIDADDIVVDPIPRNWIEPDDA